MAAEEGRLRECVEIARRYAGLLARLEDMGVSRRRVLADLAEFARADPGRFREALRLWVEARRLRGRLIACAREAYAPEVF